MQGAAAAMVVALATAQVAARRRDPLARPSFARRSRVRFVPSHEPQPGEPSPLRRANARVLRRAVPPRRPRTRSGRARRSGACVDAAPLALVGARAVTPSPRRQRRRARAQPCELTAGRVALHPGGGVRVGRARIRHDLGARLGALARAAERDPSVPRLVAPPPHRLHLLAPVARLPLGLRLVPAAAAARNRHHEHSAAVRGGAHRDWRQA